MYLSKRVTTDTVELYKDPTCQIEDTEDKDDNFLSAVTIKQQTKWLTEVRANDLPVMFKINTGAEAQQLVRPPSTSYIMSK